MSKQKNSEKYVFLATLVLSILSSILIYSIFANQRKPNESLLDRYDYIVVGGGTAGCVLAARLSEHANTSVLLVEAGDYFNILAEVPLLAAMLQGSKYDWSFKSEPQKFSSFGLNGQIQTLPRGKGLGGSSHLNYMIHGERMLYDLNEWEKIGLTNWKYDKVNVYLKSFFKNTSKTLEKRTFDTNLEQCELDDLFNLTESKAELSELLKSAIEEFEDINISYSSVKNTIFDGRRWTSFHSHLQPAFGRSNLHVLLNTEVTRVLLKNMRALGIETIFNDVKTNIYVKNDVILSAGSFMTPKILQLSGIGPSHILQKIPVKTIVNLPGVGRNLHDHLSMPLYVSVEKPISVTIDKILRIREFWNYIVHKKGVFSKTPILGLVRGPGDSGLILFGLGSTDEKYLREIANLKLETFKSLFPLHKNTSQEGFVFLSTCLKPKSRGYVAVQNSDNDLIINPEYLSKDRDIDCMIQSMKVADKIIKTEAFKNVGAKLHWPVFENCVHLEVDVNNNEYLECILRTAALTMHHPAGTCRIGSIDDNMAVVDEFLRVKGTKGLRVMDASILPEPLATFPNSVLILLAEYAYNIINNTRS